MDWESLLRLVGEEPVFSSGLLLSGDSSERQVRLQLSRWVKAGRLFQLRRGLYALAPPWRKVAPHPFLVSNRIRRGSYVSLQSALAWHGAIPEHVPMVTAVGPGRPQTFETPLGDYLFHHLGPNLRFGYSLTEVTPRQSAFVASAAKALLDLVHLTQGGDSIEFLSELRVQNLQAFCDPPLEDLAKRSGKPKLIRASRRVLAMLTEDEGELL